MTFLLLCHISEMIINFQAYYRSHFMHLHEGLLAFYMRYRTWRHLGSTNECVQQYYLHEAAELPACVPFWWKEYCSHSSTMWAPRIISRRGKILHANYERVALDHFYWSSLNSQGTPILNSCQILILLFYILLFFFFFLTSGSLKKSREVFLPFCRWPNAAHY
jgi:hypothetical protein